MPIAAFQTHRQLLFKYVTSISLNASPTGGYVAYYFHPDCATIPDGTTALGADVAGFGVNDVIAHQPHGYDTWQPVYELIAVKSSRIRFELAESTDASVGREASMFGVKLINNDTRLALESVAGGGAGDHGLADRLVETNAIRGGTLFPSVNRGRLTRSKAWNFRRWNGPLRSMTDGFTLSDAETYTKPFTATTSGDSTAARYNQPWYMVYQLAFGSHAGIDPPTIHARVTLWYHVIMKKATHPVASVVEP